MIKGIGIDIVEKERIEEILARVDVRFVERILTVMEREIMPAGKNRSEFVAGRFAAKEAFAKATGFGFGRELSFQDINVLRDERGKPVITLFKEWMERFDPGHSLTFHVSISHEKKYVIAQVIIEG